VKQRTVPRFITEQIMQGGICRRKLDRFIQAVGKLPDRMTEFDEAFWDSSLVSSETGLLFTFECTLCGTIELHDSEE
jgi:hypothetical protein